MSPPAILFMGRIFEVPWGGVREMAESLLKAAAPLACQQGREIRILVSKPGLCPVKSPAIREVVLEQFAGNRILWDHWTVSNYANRQKNAVLYNIKLVLPERLRIPGFTSIHDLMYFPQPKKYDWREYLLADSLYMRLMVRRTVRRAPFTHCDSQNTANDARELFPEVEPNRFRVIHLAVHHGRWAPREETPEDKEEWQALHQKGLRQPYILHTGGLSKRKNIVVLAEAFAEFLKSHPEYQLALTGGTKPTVRDPRLEAALAAIPKKSFVRLGTVSPRGLELLYQKACFFVFPSLYEGFGLPLLEAQAAGCPVICSNATTHPEVTGESALLFDPHSKEELLDRMVEATNPSIQEELRGRGFENTKLFTWNRTAEQWLALADEVAMRSSGR